MYGKKSLIVVVIFVMLILLIPNISIGVKPIPLDLAPSPVPVRGEDILPGYHDITITDIILNCILPVLFDIINIIISKILLSKNKINKSTTIL